MSVITDRALDERNSLFQPDEIHVAIVCETDFDFMKDPQKCKEYATKLYEE